jgi:hypothetical protein
MSKERLARFAALGALAVTLGLVVVFALFVVFTRPHVGGIDRTEAWVAWISAGLVVTLLIAAHVHFARALFGVAAGRQFGV